MLKKDKKMKILTKIAVICTSFLLLVTTGMAEEKTTSDSKTVTALYPNLASSLLTFAHLAELPQGVLIRSTNVQITIPDLNRLMRRYPRHLQEQLKKNAFFVLEQAASTKLLAELAKRNLNKTDEETAPKAGRELINKYVNQLTAKVTVADDEISLLYEENEAIFSGTPLEKVKSQISRQILQEKKQQVLNEHLRTLGQRMTILLSATWVKQQAALAKDNPLNKARENRKPTIALFSTPGCCGPDKITPIIKSLTQKYAAKLNIVYLDARKQEILAARYNVRLIPTQIFYDKTGKEVFRHTGFLSKQKIEKKLTDIGVK